jgi:hypothetical protein
MVLVRLRVDSLENQSRSSCCQNSIAYTGERPAPGSILTATSHGGFQERALGR